MAAGADMAFMVSPPTEDEMRTLVKELAPHPVLINVLPVVRCPVLGANKEIRTRKIATPIVAIQNTTNILSYLQSPRGLTTS